MNPFEMVAVIVVAVMLASVLRAKYGHGGGRRGDGEGRSGEDQAETLRLREEVKALKDRIHEHFILRFTILAQLPHLVFG